MYKVWEVECIKPSHLVIPERASRTDHNYCMLTIIISNPTVI